MPPVALDAAGFDALYESHVEYVWSTLRRFGVAEADLEDLAHDVFVVVHRRFSELDRSRSPKPWLFGIALRVAAKYRRTARRRCEVGDERLETATDGAPGPDAHVAANDARAIVHEALHRLNEDQRAVFVLHELEGVPCPEIAEQLGVSVNTIYSRLRLAREQFAAAVSRTRRPR
jgi:RNA polymerase sigma-70 factor (ECF subfamily)